ncbi:UNKNOWN [Stylonychia lemnae]|uniref:Uncharacterized protein n=1 Tax=Stylonychia lemnae TaxID=5949 RepID=A0A078A7B1_STYLE|nr:UNKNOWN [Stylonychia lemnae]|eukprot:CDW77766.1 UNKNOWN [Stylonychia lemnae]
MKSNNHGGNSLESDPDLLEIRRQIESLVNGSTNQAKTLTNNYTYEQNRNLTNETADMDLDDIIHSMEKQSYKVPSSTQKEDYSKEVNEILRAAFQVEDEAASIKHKYQKPKYEQTSITKNDLFNFNFSHQPTDQLIQKNSASVQKFQETSNKYSVSDNQMNSKNLSKNDKKMIADVIQEDDKAEDMMIALSLLNKYKKDPNFIQKELQTHQKKKEEEKKADNNGQSIFPGKKVEYFNPLLTQEERHRQIKEKREKRVKEQKEKQLEEVKEKTKPKDSYKLPSQTIKRESKMKPQIHQQSNNNKNLNSDLNSLRYQDYDEDDNEFENQYSEEYNIDKKLEKTRKEHEDIFKAAQEQKQIAQQIKEDIKKYSQAIKEQEKAQKEFQIQQEQKKRLEIEKQKMEIELQNSKKKMNEFKLQKVGVILGQVIQNSLKQVKYQAFEAINTFNLELQFKEQKLARHQKFQTTRKFFRVWIQQLRKQIQQRELEEYEKEQQRQRVMEQTAENHFLRILKRKCFKSLVKNIKNMQNERQIQEEHDKMKNQIDSFFTNLKEKAKNEEEKLKQLNEYNELSEQMLSNFDSSQQINQDRNQFLSQTQNAVPYQMQEPSVDTINFSQYEENKESMVTYNDNIMNISRQPMRPSNIDSSSVSNQTQSSAAQRSRSNIGRLQKQQKPLQPVVERPKHVIEMEIRAKDRKNKRQELDKVYEEKRKKAEEDKRLEELKKEEEKKKKLQDERDQKRARIREANQKIEEEKKQKEVEFLKLKNAKEYYNRGLIIKYVILPLSKLVDLASEKALKADLHNLKRIKRNGLSLLKEGLMVQSLEEEQKINKLNRIADRFFEVNQYKLEKKVLQRKYLSNLKRSALTFWRLTIPELRKERINIQLREELLIKKFRIMKIGKPIFDAIKSYAKESRLEQEKKVYKDQMWGKVNSWLHDFDKRTNLLIAEITTQPVNLDYNSSKQTHHNDDYEIKKEMENENIQQNDKKKYTQINFTETSMMDEQSSELSKIMGIVKEHRFDMFDDDGAFNDDKENTISNNKSTIEYQF